MQETWIDLNMGNSKYTVFAVWIPDVFRHISVESYIFNSDEVLNPKVGSNYWNRILLNCIKNNLFRFIYTCTWKKHMWIHKFWKCFDDSYLNVQWSFCPSFCQFSTPSEHQTKCILDLVDKGSQTVQKNYLKSSWPVFLQGIPLIRANSLLECIRTTKLQNCKLGEKGESAPGYDICH